MDLRVSGKDLIGNHLTMSLYNHAAVWPDRPDLWPRSIYTNGFVMVRPVSLRCQFLGRRSHACACDRPLPGG